MKAAHLKALEHLPKVIEALEALALESEKLRDLMLRAGVGGVVHAAGRDDLNDRNVAGNQPTATTASATSGRLPDPPGIKSRFRAPEKANPDRARLLAQFKEDTGHEPDADELEALDG